MHDHTIVGDKYIKIGMRVFTNDWEWGTVLDSVLNNQTLEKVPHEPESEASDTCKAWFEVQLDPKVGRDHTVIRQYDCTRLSVSKPRG